MIKRMKCDTGIGQVRFDIEYPPFGNPKGRAYLSQFPQKVSRPYPDMLIDTFLDLVTNSLRQNGSICVQVALNDD